jgi:8-oxo-dGTP diphosphatase
VVNGATVTPDHEHDDFAWWPSDLSEWPAEGDEPLRRLAGLVSA